MLTIYFRNSSLMLAFIRDNNTAKSVTEIFDWLYEQLGHEVFTSLFQVILTDREKEIYLNRRENNLIRAMVAEHISFIVIHSVLIKKVVVKLHIDDSSCASEENLFDNLTQDDINLMMSHINSYNRKKSWNNQSAHPVVQLH